jgi:uncharacterized protein
MSMSDQQLSPEPSMDEILASIRRILAEDQSASAPPPPRVRLNDDVLDLTEAMNEDGSVRHIAPKAPATPERRSPALPDGRLEPARPRSTDVPAALRLASDKASEAVAESFARLAGMTRQRGDDGSLEDIVRETLRPLLQSWLDEHLPALVERLVRAEIARMVGVAGAAKP